MKNFDQVQYLERLLKSVMTTNSFTFDFHITDNIARINMYYGDLKSMFYQQMYAGDVDEIKKKIMALARRIYMDYQIRIFEQNAAKVS